MLFNSWMLKEDWSKQMCEMHQIGPKIQITNILHGSFVELGKDLEKLDFPQYVEKQTLRTSIAVQILSIGFELTEDLAATCFSYAKAIKNKTKDVPEYLRDFGDPAGAKKSPEEVGTPKFFYDKSSKDICYAAEMMGLDPIVNVAESVNAYTFFKNILGFRQHYEDWYQGYKHGQRTWPIYTWPPTLTAARDNVNFLIYRIPELLQEKDGKIFVEADFVDLIKEEEKIFALINEVGNIWTQVKARQFPKVFT